jgi:hypothetical protein
MRILPSLLQLSAGGRFEAVWQSSFNENVSWRKQSPKDLDPLNDEFYVSDEACFRAANTRKVVRERCLLCCSSSLFASEIALYLPVFLSLPPPHMSIKHLFYTLIYVFNRLASE